MSEHRLNEIVIERPRGGMRLRSTRLKGSAKLLHQLTKEASEEGLLSPYVIKVRQGTKHLSDHLGPLRRWLRSHVGQSWDSLYSQLCHHLDTQTMSGQHVLSHLWHYVERDVEIIDGIPYRKAQGRYRLGPLGQWHHDYYIHPETRILCLAQTRSPEPSPAPEDLIPIGPDHQYQKLEGIWYQITLKPSPELGSARDAILKTWVSHHPQTKYAAQKRQCNKKELKWINRYLALGKASGVALPR